MDDCYALFLTDCFVNASFRREILRVLNRGEAVNSLKRALYTGRVAGHQAKREDEMQAVADALSLLARQRVPPELIARIAPTRTEGINLRGVFSFPIHRFADQLLPSARGAEKQRAAQ